MDENAIFSSQITTLQLNMTESIITGTGTHRTKLKTRNLSDAGIILFRVRQIGLGPLSKNDITEKYREDKFSIISRLLQGMLNCEQIDLDAMKKIRGYLSNGHLANTGEFRRMISYLPGPQPEESLQYQYPEIAAEWDYERNYPLKPDMFGSGSNEKVHWICSAGHRWKAVVCSRTVGKRGCKACLKRIATPEHNLAIRFPKIASEWHPSLNGDATPHDVTPRSNKKRFWSCGKCGFTWEATVYNRTNGSGCPECYFKRRQHRS